MARRQGALTGRARWAADAARGRFAVHGAGLARLILFRFPPGLQATTTPAKQRFAGVFVLRRHASRRVRKAARCHHLGLTPDGARAAIKHTQRSEEHTSELQSLMRLSY